MASKQDSPFSGLDKALLRSTQQKQHQPAERKTPASDRVPAESNDPLQKSPSVEAGPSRATTKDKQLSRKPDSKIDIFIDSYHDSKISLYHSDLRGSRCCRSPAVDFGLLTSCAILCQTGRNLLQLG